MAVVPLRILKNSKRKRKIYKMTWKTQKIARESLYSTIIILKSDGTSNGMKLLSLSHPVVLLKEIKSFNSIRTPSLCYWVPTIKCPSSFLTVDTVLSQVRHIAYKRCVWYLWIVDHRDGSGHLYLMNETAGPKNIDQTISYPMHYLKSSGKLPSWVQRVYVFMDNAGSTNINLWWLLLKLYNKELWTIFIFHLW